MKIFNTLTRRKEEFKSVKENKVTMYVCGPTVYDLFHIGNARTFIFFDVVRNYFEYKGYSVEFVQNFTDIDDKIIKKANQEGKNIYEISEKYIEEYYKDADDLNIKRAAINPKATENVKEMIELIEELIERGFAYEAKGDVYFSVKSFKEYGKLFGQDIDTFKVGARISINDKKRDSLDFILWKNAKDGEESFDCPWGKGRPGWHTECSAMVRKYFNNEVIDIHGGGFDLIFPHHENEIAQIECLENRQICNYWMHCSFLNIDNKKMSKSLGNFFTTREIIQKYSSDVLRFFVLSSHYRSELYFSEEQLVWSKKSLERIYKSYYLLIESLERNENNNIGVIFPQINEFKDEFCKKMDDDFNTSDAITVMFEFTKFINLNIIKFSSDTLKQSKDLFDNMFRVLGLNMKVKKNEHKIVLDDEVYRMIFERYEAKKSRNFKLADSLRDSLFERGLVIEDIRDGVRVSEKENNVLIDTVYYTK